MPLLPNSIPTRPITPGNCVNIPEYSYAYEVLHSPIGVYEGMSVGVIKLTTAPQNNVQPTLPSKRQRQQFDPDRPLVLPAGCTITYVGVRMPPQRSEGKYYGVVDSASQILGTAGENIRLIGLVGGAPVFASNTLMSCPANGVWVPDSFGAQDRPWAQADQALGGTAQWITTTADTSIFFQVVNAASSALGNGIFLSPNAREAILLVDVRWIATAKPISLEQHGLPFDPGA